MSLIDEELAAIEQFRRLPEVRPPLEFFGGRAIQKMSPKLPHSIIQGELFFRLTVHSRRANSGQAFVELRCTFRGSSHVFDICYFTQERVPQVSEDDERADVEIAPDLAIEILSPGQTVGELARKLRSAIRRGVGVGWLIDRSRKRVGVFRPRSRARVLGPGDVLSGEDVIPGFAIPLDEMFGWLRNK